MTEESYEWRAQQANDGKARRFELWNLEKFKVVLSVHAKESITVNEMQRLVSLGK